MPSSEGEYEAEGEDGTGTEGEPEKRAIMNHFSHSVEDFIQQTKSIEGDLHKLKKLSIVRSERDAPASRGHEDPYSTFETNSHRRSASNNTASDTFGDKRRSWSEAARREKRYFAFEKGGY